MPRSSKTTTTDDDKEKKSLSTILTQALAANSKPTEATFPELPIVLFWMRGLLGLGLGLFLGHHQITGASVLMHVLNCLSFVPTMYVYVYLGVPRDSNQFGGVWKTLWSGMAPAMALTLLVWMYLFTAMNERQVELLNDMLVNGTVAAEHVVDSDGGGRIGEATEGTEF